MPNISSYLKPLIFTFLFNCLVTAQSEFPPVQAFEAGQLSKQDDGIFCQFPNEKFTQFDEDGNISVYTTQFGVLETLWSSSANDQGNLIPGNATTNCSSLGVCLFEFQSDGDFVASWENTLLWHSGTAGRGVWLVCQEIEPYLYVLDEVGDVIWSARSG